MISPSGLALLSALVLIGLIVLRMPIAFALGIVGFGGLALLDGFDGALATLYILPYERLNTWVFMAVALYILMGHFAFRSGVGSDAYAVGQKWIGRLPGGLAVASIIGCAGFAATSGSSVATAVTMGKIAIPEMRRYGYDPKLATGSVAAGGLLGIMIPPSLVMIIYGLITGTSIGALFIAGVLPGILTVVVFSLGIMILVLRRPSLAPPVAGATWRQRFASLAKAWRMVLLFLIVIGGIYAGVYTATEAAAVGAFFALLMLIFAAGMKSWRWTKEAFWETSRTTSMILILVLLAMLYAQFLVRTGATRSVSSALLALPVSSSVLVIILMALYIPMGMFLDPTSMMLLTLPLFFPVFMETGANAVWLGIMVTKLMELSLITPPVGINVFVIKGIVPDVSLDDVFRGVFWFMIMELVTVVLLFSFPQISLFLPGVMRR